MLGQSEHAFVILEGACKLPSIEVVPLTLPTRSAGGFYFPHSAQTNFLIEEALLYFIVVPNPRFCASHCYQAFFFRKRMFKKNGYLNVILTYISHMNEVEHLFIHLRAIYYFPVNC